MQKGGENGPGRRRAAEFSLAARLPSQLHGVRFWAPSSAFGAAGTELIHRCQDASNALSPPGCRRSIWRTESGGSSSDPCHSRRMESIIRWLASEIIRNWKIDQLIT